MQRISKGTCSSKMEISGANWLNLAQSALWGWFCSASQGCGGALSDYPHGLVMGGLGATEVTGTTQLWIYLNNGQACLLKQYVFIYFHCICEVERQRTRDWKTERIGSLSLKQSLAESVHSVCARQIPSPSSCICQQGLWFSLAWLASSRKHLPAGAAA